MAIQELKNLANFIEKLRILSVSVEVFTEQHLIYCENFRLTSISGKKYLIPELIICYECGSRKSVRVMDVFFVELRPPSDPEVVKDEIIKYISKIC